MTDLQFGAGVLVPEAVLAVCPHCSQGGVGRVEGNVVHLSMGGEGRGEREDGRGGEGRGEVRSAVSY